MVSILQKIGTHFRRAHLSKGLSENGLIIEASPIVVAMVSFPYAKVPDNSELIEGKKRLIDMLTPLRSGIVNAIELHNQTVDAAHKLRASVDYDTFERLCLLEKKLEEHPYLKEMSNFRESTKDLSLLEQQALSQAAEQYLDGEKAITLEVIKEVMGSKPALIKLDQTPSRSQENHQPLGSRPQ